MSGFEITEIAAQELGHITCQTWLGKTTPELFREYLRPSDEARRSLLSSRFEKLIARTDATALLCKRSGDYLAVIGFEHQDWDSQHFGVKCGKLSPYCISPDLSCAEQQEIHRLMLGYGIEWARRHKIKVLQRRLLSCRLHEVNVLEELGFHLVDNVVTLAAPIKDVLSVAQERGGKLEFRSPIKSDLDTLISMTRGAFPYSRFVNEKAFPAGLGDDLYLKWLTGLFGDITEKTANESADQGMILVSVEDQIAGYIAYKVDRELARAVGQCIATIELIVVDPAFQGMGIGKNLLWEATRVLSETGTDLLESSTWINQRLAMASNQKAGLRVCENMFTYHLNL